MKKGFPLMLACCIAAAGLMTSCGGNKINTEDDGSFATIEYWFSVAGMAPPDLKAVNDEINKIVKEKINAEVILKPVEANNYATTMAVKINANDKFDICFSAEWSNSYIENAKKGAYADITNLLPEYAPTIWNTVAPDIWKAATINGKIYGVVNTQIMPRQAGVVVRKDMADAFGLNIDSIKKYEDLTPFLAYSKKNSGSKEIAGVFDMNGVSLYLGWDDFGRYDIPGVIQSNDSSLTVYNQFESPEFKNIMALGKSWYDKGYYNPDVLTAVPDYTKLVMKFLPTYKPSCEADERIATGADVVAIPFGDSKLYTNWTLSSLNAISATSKNPVKALKFLELLYSDDQLFNTLIYGIEGKNYKKTGTNRVEVIPNSGYSLPSGWEFGNQFNQWLIPSQPDDVWEKTKEINKNASQSVAYGFIFDQTNVRTEIANCKAVYDEYWMALLLGLFGDDTQTEYQNFISKMKDAGSGKIVAEKQKQLDAWKLAK